MPRPTKHDDAEAAERFYKQRSPRRVAVEALYDY